MQRREFIQLTSAAAILSPFGYPRYASAEITLAAVSSGFSLASAVMGFLSRGSDPTVPLLISLSEMVTALGIKIDAIDQKLDLLISELAELRKLTEALPTEVALLDVTLDLREPWNGFVELGGKEPPITPSNHYLNELPRTYRRLQIARRKFMDLSLDRAQPVFDGAVDLALAQDAEITLAEEMLRPEIFDRGQALDLAVHRRALQEYERFFARGLDPNEENSLASLKLRHEQEARKLLGLDADEQVDIGAPRAGTYLHHLISGERDVVFACSEIINTCQRWHSNGRYGGYCAEPGSEDGPPFDHRATLRFGRKAVPDSHGVLDDSFGAPFLFEAISKPQCPESSNGVRFVGGSPSEAEQRRLDLLNRAIINYYRIHYAEEVAALALEFNRKLQADISELIGA